MIKNHKLAGHCRYVAQFVGYLIGKYHAELVTEYHRHAMNDFDYSDPLPLQPVQSIPVYLAGAFAVVNGANLHDAIAISDELNQGDIYALEPMAKRVRLSLKTGDDGIVSIAADTDTGTPDALIFADCTITLMSPDGITSEAIVLVELDAEDIISRTFLLPLAPLRPKVDYSLVGIDTDSAREKLAQVACVSFARGTHITMATGEQRKIEDLSVGDRVLTRDDGIQQIRWVGRSTVRGQGPFAPILIRKGAMHNENDLIMSPDHRLFIYQRSDKLGAGRSELLIKARHLVNGETIVKSEGGFVDYFQLLFDQHQIIYAEGIAAESLLVDNRTRAALPDDLAHDLTEALKEHAISGHLDLEVQERLLNLPDAAAVLRRASTSG